MSHCLESSNFHNTVLLVAFLVVVIVVVCLFVCLPLLLLEVFLGGFSSFFFTNTIIQLLQTQH